MCAPVLELALEVTNVGVYHGIISIQTPFVWSVIVRDIAQFY